MKSIVISLKSAIGRRQHITQEFQNHHIDFEFFDALTPDIVASYAKNLPINLQDSSLTGGELACMMSHVSVWQKMIDEQIPYLAIFEDDVYLGEDAEFLLNSSDWINPEWHIVKIEAFTKKVFVSSNRYPIESTNRYITQLKGENLGTAGYILSLQGAQKYLDYLAHHQLRPLDELMFDDFIACGSEPVYQMMPALCIQEMLLNKETPALPSALIKERKDRMHSEKKQAYTKLKERLLG